MAAFQMTSHVLTGEGDSPAGAGGGPRFLEFHVWEAATGDVRQVRIDVDAAVAELIKAGTRATWGSAAKVENPRKHLLPDKYLLEKIENAKKNRQVPVDYLPK